MRGLLVEQPPEGVSFRLRLSQLCPQPMQFVLSVSEPCGFREKGGDGDSFVFFNMSSRTPSISSSKAAT
jgi:hypothetical protein